MHPHVSFQVFWCRDYLRTAYTLWSLTSDWKFSFCPQPRGRASLPAGLLSLFLAVMAVSANTNTGNIVCLSRWRISGQQTFVFTELVLVASLSNRADELKHHRLWLESLVPFTFLIKVLLEMSGQAVVDLPGHAVTWPALRVTFGRPPPPPPSCCYPWCNATDHISASGCRTEGLQRCLPVWTEAPNLCQRPLCLTVHLANCDRTAQHH